MRAAFYDRQGPAAEVLTVGDVPTPQPGPGEVLVRIAFSAVNPSDVKHRSGQVGAMAHERVIPHQDGAGSIVAVGARVDPARVGERVWIYEAQTGRAFGTAARYIALPAAQAVTLPDGVSLQTGATLGVPALTAHRCLFEGHALLGRRVLVQGGAGAVGRAAIQLARWAGAWVCATVRRPHQRGAALAAGASLVLDHADPDIAATIRTATGGRGVDLIVDVDITANLALDLACLAPGGTISAYATPAGTAQGPVPSILPLMRANASLRYVYVYTVPAPAKLAAIGDVSACLVAGGLEPQIGEVLPLQDIAAAHQAIEQGSGAGRILLRMD